MFGLGVVALAQPATTSSLGSRSHTTTEIALPARRRPRRRAGADRCRARAGHEIRRRSPRRLLLHPHERRAAANFRLVTAPVADPAAGELEGAHPPPRGRDARRSFDVFQDHYVPLRARGRAAAAPRHGPRERRVEHEIEFPEPTYDVGPGDQRRVRHARASASATSRFVTPPSVYDYDVKTRQRDAAQAAAEVLGGYDPPRYTLRASATRRPPTARGCPISSSTRRDAPRDGNGARAALRLRLLRHPVRRRRSPRTG